MNTEYYFGSIRRRVFWCALFVLLIALTPLSPAATIVWTNVAGGNWSSSNNWNPNSVPGAADVVVITNVGTYTVTLDVNATNTGLTLGGAGGTQSLAAFFFNLELNGTSRVNSNGVLEVQGSTISGSGTLTLQGICNATNSTFNAAVVNQNQLTFRGSSCGLGTSFVNQSNATLRLLGDGGVDQSVVTASGGLTNSGIIELTSINSASPATLNLTSGTLVNATGGQINVLAGAGGGRNLNVQLDNRGTMSVGADLTWTKFSVDHFNSGTINVTGGDLTLNHSQAFTNSGAISISAGRTFTISGGSFVQNGTLSGAGAIFFYFATAYFTPNFNNAVTALRLQGATIEGPGTITNVTGLDATNCTINAPLVNQSLLTFRGSSCGLGTSFVNQSAGTLRLLGDGGVDQASVNAAGGFTNSGVIELTSVNSASPATLNLTSGTLVNATGGQINVLAGAGGGRNFGVQLDNRGTISVGADLTWTKFTVDHFNSGTINITGGDLTLNQSQAFTNNGAISISAGRTFTISGGSFVQNGTLSGAGAIYFYFATGYFTVNFNNAVTVLRLVGATIEGPGTITNVTGLNPTNCTINAPLVNQNLLTFRGGSCGLGSSFVNQPGATLRLLGDGGVDQSSVNAAGGFTNSGIIELTSINSASAATLNLTSGTLVNATGGQINVLAGAGGGRNLGVQLDNRGTISVGADLTWTKFSVDHSNSGTISITGGGVVLNQSGDFANSGTITLGSNRLFAVAGGSLNNIAPGILQGIGTLDVTSASFTNAGNVNPGTSPGRLTVVGIYNQTSAGALNIELGGTAAGTNFDQLVVSGDANLAGTLRAALTNGFYPAPDFIFTNVLRAAARNGTFATFSYPSNVIGLQVNYGPTNASIEVINTLPRIPLIGSQTLDELTLLSFNINAMDGDAPPQSLFYSLINSPTNAAINSSGLLTWNPTEAQGPVTTNITVVVTDNGTPALTSNQTFQVTVREINVVPVLTVPTNQTINELTFYTNNASATDADLPANALVFSLVSGPSNLTVAASGPITWTPSEAQGPGVYVVQVRVTDTNPPAFNVTSLSTTNSFTLTVNEVNLAPVLGALTNFTVNPGQTITFTATATDPDLPTNTLNFTLVGPPSGAQISGAGLFTWRPSVAQANATNTIQVRVTDNGAPVMSDTDPVTVVVGALAPVVLSGSSYSNAQFRFQISGTAGPDYVVQATGTLTNWTDIATNLSPVPPFQFTDTAAGSFSNRYYRVRLQP